MIRVTALRGAGVYKPILFSSRSMCQFHVLLTFTCQIGLHGMLYSFSSSNQQNHLVIHPYSLSLYWGCLRLNSTLLLSPSYTNTTILPVLPMPLRHTNNHGLQRMALLILAALLSRLRRLPPPRRRRLRSLPRPTRRLSRTPRRRRLPTSRRQRWLPPSKQQH